MARKSRHVALEGLRYLAAAGVALAVDFGLYVGLIRLADVPYLVAAPVAFALGLVTIYVLSIRWVFDHRRLPNARAEFLVFAGIGLAGMALNQLVIMLGVEKLALSFELAKGLSAVTVFGFNFGVRKLLLFRAPRRPAAAAAEAKPAAAPAVAADVTAGMQAHYEGDLDTARRHYERVLAADPRNADALYLLGELETRREAWPQAALLFRRALVQNPNVAAYHAGLGTALRCVGKYGKAADCFRRALRLDAACAEAYVGLGICMQEQGQLSEAHHYYRRWLELRVKQGDRGAPIAAPGTPREIPRTTVCCIDTRTHELAGLALERTLARCRFARALMFTDRDFPIEGVETVRIPTIRSLEDYSRFVVKDLVRHIDTDFVLLIQYDGYVLDAARWSDEFLRYDYIGARWVDCNDGMCVGNGGFSLRSKRLLLALQDAAITDVTPEDRAICRTYRPLLESRYGIRFAGAAIADAFAFETISPQTPTFGFHGLAHLARLYDMPDAQVAQYRPPASAILRA